MNTKVTANKVKIKNVMKVDEMLFKVIKIEHVKPGKGPAYISFTLKNLTTANQQKKRFRVDEEVKLVDIIEQEVIHTYNNNKVFFFLDNEGNEIGVLENQIPYKELIESGVQYKLIYADEELISLSLPHEIEVTVAFAPPFINGQSATCQLKTIKTTNNMEIEVPQYIKKGDVLKISSDLEFIKRI